MRNLSTKEVSDLNWRDISKEQPIDGQIVYSRQGKPNHIGYNSGTKWSAASRMFYTKMDRGNRIEVTIWKNDQWAYHPDIEEPMARQKRLKKLRLRAGNLGWEIANHQAYGHHFPQSWNDELAATKELIAGLEKLEMKK